MVQSLLTRFQSLSTRMTNTEKQTVVEMLTKRVRWFFALPNHWFAWFVAGLTTLAMVIICVPGELERRSLIGGGWSAGPPPGPYNIDHFDHGWPFTVLKREIHYGGQGFPDYSTDYEEGYRYPFIALLQTRYWLRSKNGGPEISWTIPTAWSISGAVVEWQPNLAWRFAANTIAVAFFILISIRIAERWVRIRGGVFRITLLDVFISMSLIACLLGWRHWNIQQHKHTSVGSVPYLDYRRHRFADLTPRPVKRLIGNDVFTWWDNYPKVLYFNYLGNSLKDNHPAGGPKSVPWATLKKRYCLDTIIIQSIPYKKLFNEIEEFSTHKTCNIEWPCFLTPSRKRQPEGNEPV